MKIETTFDISDILENFENVDLANKITHKITHKKYKKNTD